MMPFRVQFLKVFESMFLAWAWLLIVVIHVGFFSENIPEGTIFAIFDQLVFASCFLIYAHSNSVHMTLWPFFFQFLLWWLVGAFMLWLYRKLAARNL